MLGFTEDEVEFLIDECCIERAKITIDRKFLYNGYKFHVNASNKLYNSAMILYILDKIRVAGEVEKIIDLNLKTDYGRIIMLLDKPQNIEKLEQIIEHEKIAAEVIERFSIEKIHDSNNFMSLIYYMGW